MRTALLIGLVAASIAGAAQAQMSPYVNPYGMGPRKNPYDLPKALQGKPNLRDYSKPDPAIRGPGYHNADGWRRQAAPSNAIRVSQSDMPCCSSALRARASR